MYHGVVRDDEEISVWTLLRESSFREQMLFLRDSFDCVSIDQALERDGKVPLIRELFINRVTCILAPGG